MLRLKKQIERSTLPPIIERSNTRCLRFEVSSCYVLLISPTSSSGNSLRGLCVFGLCSGGCQLTVKHNANQSTMCYYIGIRFYV
jgi:hypothetical protein